MTPSYRTSHPCPACGSSETFRVSMVLSEAPGSFTSCHACEWKGWERGGERLTLESVLDLVAAR